MPLAVSPFTGALGGRIGSRPLVVAGLLLLAAGTAGSALAMGVGASYAELVGPLVAIGLGIALVLPNVASAALGSALPEHIGKASGTNSTFRQLGARVRHRRRGAGVRPRRLLRVARARRRRRRAPRSSWRARRRARRSWRRSGSRPGPPAARPRAHRRARPTPLAELEARQRHAARAASCRARARCRRRRSARRRGEGSRRRRRRAPDRARSRAGRRGNAARQPARFPGGSCGSAFPASSSTGTVDGHDPRSSGTRAPGHAAQALPEELCARRRRRAPESSRGSLARSQRRRSAPTPRCRSSSRTGAGGRGHRARHPRRSLNSLASGASSPEAASCTSSGTRAASSGERSSTATVVASAAAVRGCSASTRLSSPRVSGKARRQAICA